MTFMTVFNFELLTASQIPQNSKFLKQFQKQNSVSVRKIYMARDGKYSHCAGKFTDTMRVKDQIEK
jgi:hypothetical protein